MSEGQPAKLRSFGIEGICLRENLLNCLASCYSSWIAYRDPPFECFIVIIKAKVMRIGIGD